MNWEAVGSIGEVLGSIVVVVSVVYLAAQLKQANRLGEAGAIQEWYAQWNALFSAWTESPEKTRVIRAGFTNFETLPPADKALVHTAFASILNHTEMSHDLYSKGMIPLNLKDKIDEIAVMIMTSPGGKQFWQIAGPGFRGGGAPGSPCIRPGSEHSVVG